MIHILRYNEIHIFDWTKRQKMTISMQQEKLYLSSYLYNDKNNISKLFTLSQYIF
ncbi:hypothetical protein NIES21_21500 [Anabaenopsis circularis NIES-21]|uniref:Uncharacterized protein n=1 Tax=Anabaenopsis circularis NIES-21 TaxID=1085406 RepID=A0A1Z4GFQ2_9CYAN|nr:hypothetical protein NIES21_21500 [Anabaenopsis circularis NIES-21]